MNRVEIAGGLTRDAELRFTPSGAAVLNMTVAVNGTRYDGDSRQQVVTTSYISVEAWGSLAEEAAEQDIVKGCEVYVLGELTQSTTEKRDGSKESKTRVRAMMIHVTRRRGGSAQARAAVASAADLPRPTPSRSAEPPPHSEPPPGYGPDEEPFLVDAGSWWPQAGIGAQPDRMLP